MPTKIKLVPESGKLVVLVSVILVPDPPVPKALSPRAPFSVVVIAEPSSPPQDQRPQPKPFC